MSLIKKYLEEKARMDVDEIDTDDYKLDKNGKKHKAGKIVFKKGEDDGKQIGEELKGNQHKLDKNKNGKLDKHDFKLLRKEDAKQMTEFYERSPEMTHHKLVNGQPKVPSRVASGHIHLHHISGTANSDNAKYKVLAVHEKSPLKAKVGSTISGTKVNDHMDDGRGGHVHVHSAKPDSDFMNEDYEQINELEFTEEDIENFMQTEEFEQLDELSKNLVHRYYGKAIRSHAATLQKDLDIGDEHQKIKRLMSKTNKGYQLGSRNKNPIHHPEVQKHLKAASDAVAKMREPAQKEMAKREKGIKKAYSKLNSGKDSDGNKVVKATGKLTNKRMYSEEIEQVDEAGFDAMKHIDKKNQTPAIKAASKLVKPTSYADRAALMKAGKVKDDRGPRGVTQEEAELDEGFFDSLKKGYEKGLKTGLKQKIKPEHHNSYNIDSVKSTSDAISILQKANQAGHTHMNEEADMAKAVDRLTKEEVEINERSLTSGEKTEMEKNVKGMKKNFKSFVDKYGKDRAENVMYATATKNAMKEEAELDESSESWYKDQEAKAEREARAAVGPKNSATVDKIRAMMAKEKADKMKKTNESVFDWKNTPKQTKDKNTTSTYHDVKKISTGTVYTKQFDKDGTSKGTGDDAAKKAVGAEKRGRGRPKKDKFAEAVEFLMDLTEEQFDTVVEEGFDSFVESFLEEGYEGKGNHKPGWMLKADPELKKKIEAAKAKAKAKIASGNK